MSKLMTCGECPHYENCWSNFAAPKSRQACPARTKERELTEVLGKALNSLEEQNKEYHYNTSAEVIAELRKRFGITDTEQKLPGEYA